MRDSIGKTLIIRFSSVGDIVLSTQLVRVLRRRFPESQIDYLVKSEFADLLRHDPNISHVLEYPTGGKFRDLFQLRRTLRAAGYDTIIDIHDSLRSRFLCLGARHVRRVRKRKIARFVLVAFKRDMYSVAGGAPGIAERYLETVREFGIRDDGAGLELHVPPEARASAAARLGTAGFSGTGPMVGICPGARHGNKIWPKERFAEAACGLATAWGAGIVLFGSVAEEGLCEEILRMIGRDRPAITVLNMAGKLSLIETASAMDACALLLTNDSGLMHIGAARKRKMVAIFGPTVRQFGFFPYGTSSIVIEHPGLECRPCTHIGLPACPKGHFRCMKEIPASRVLDAARTLGGDEPVQ